MHDIEMTSLTKRINRAYIYGGGRIIDGPIFRTHLNNFGKTPAILSHISVAVYPKNELPAAPVYKKEPIGFHIQPAEREAFAHADRDLRGIEQPIVYGRFWYQDIFGDDHSSGFILQIQNNQPIWYVAADL